jgi:hypothetical protein
MVAQHRFTCAFAHDRRVPPVRGRLAARLAALLIATALVFNCTAAAAHGIAGNRLFPGTLSIDDPAVSDEFALTPSSVNKRAADGTGVTDLGVSWQFMRLLVPNLALVVDSGFTHRDWQALQRTGFDTTTVSLKGLLYESDPHEVLLSAALSWGIGRVGIARGRRHRAQHVSARLLFRQRLRRSSRPSGMAAAVRGHRRARPRNSCRLALHDPWPQQRRLGARPAALRERPDPALGFFDPVQHLLFDAAL